MDAAGDQAGIVGHVDHEERPHRAGDLRELGVVDLAGISARTSHDEFRLVLAGLLGHVIEIDTMIALPHAVRNHVVELSREIDRAAVRQVTALGQVHRQIPVARLEHGQVDGHVGLRAGVRLHVGMVAAEEAHARRRANSSMVSITSQPP